MDDREARLKAFEEHGLNVLPIHIGRMRLATHKELYEDQQGLGAEFASRLGLTRGTQWFLMVSSTIASALFAYDVSRTEAEDEWIEANTPQEEDFNE